MKIVHIAVLIDSDNPDEMADALNEALRPALQDENSLIFDYAMNVGGNDCPQLRPPIAYVQPGLYEEGEFTHAITPNIQSANL
jgi:hypothetical protein